MKINVGGTNYNVEIAFSYQNEAFAEPSKVGQSASKVKVKVEDQPRKEDTLRVLDCVNKIFTQKLHIKTAPQGLDENEFFNKLLDIAVDRGNNYQANPITKLWHRIKAFIFGGPVKYLKIEELTEQLNKIEKLTAEKQMDEFGLGDFEDLGLESDFEDSVEEIGDDTGERVGEVLNNLEEGSESRGSDES